MAQLNLDLALHLLARKKPWTDQRRMDCVATALSLLGGNWLAAEGDAYRLVRTTVDGMVERRYSVDAKLLRDIYTSCPNSLKLSLVSTLAFVRLEPSTFKLLFRDAYRLKPAALSQQLVLAYALEFFIHLNEKRAHEYQDVVVSFLRSPKPSLCFRGLYQAGYLNDLERRDLELMKRNLYKRSSMRTHAMNGLTRLLRRRREVSPRVLAFCLDPTIQAKAEHLSTKDKDDYIRDSASSLLKALREARQDVRTLRQLKAAGYPPP